MAARDDAFTIITSAMTLIAKMTLLTFLAREVEFHFGKLQITEYSCISI